MKKNKKEDKDSNELAVQKATLESNFENLKVMIKHTNEKLSNHRKEFKKTYSKEKFIFEAVTSSEAVTPDAANEAMHQYADYLTQKFSLLLDAQNAQSSAVKTLVELKGLGLSDDVAESGRLKKERAKLGSMKKNMSKQFAGNCNFLMHVYSKTKDNGNKNLIVSTLKNMASQIDPDRLRKFADNRLKKVGNLQKERGKLIKMYGKVGRKKYSKIEIRMMRVQGAYKTDGAGRSINDLTDTELEKFVKSKRQKEIKERLEVLNEKSDNVSGALVSILPEEMVLASDLLYDSSQSYKNDVMEQFSGVSFNELVTQGIPDLSGHGPDELSIEQKYGDAVNKNKDVLACEAFLDAVSQQVDLTTDYADAQSNVYAAIEEKINDPAKVENLKKDFERKLAVFKLFEFEPSKRPDVRILKTKKLKPTEGITLQDSPSPSDESQSKSEDGWICTMNLEGTKTNLSLEFDGKGELTGVTIPKSLSTKKKFTSADQKLITDVVNKIKVTDDKIVLRGNYSVEFQVLMKQAVDARNKKDGTKIEFVAGGDIPTPAPESVEELENNISNDSPESDVNDQDEALDDSDVAISAASGSVPEAIASEAPSPSSPDATRPRADTMDILLGRQELTDEQAELTVSTFDGEETKEREMSAVGSDRIIPKWVETNTSVHSAYNAHGLIDIAMEKATSLESEAGTSLCEKLKALQTEIDTKHGAGAETPSEPVFEGLTSLEALLGENGFEDAPTNFRQFFDTLNEHLQTLKSESVADNSPAPGR